MSNKEDFQGLSNAVHHMLSRNEQMLHKAARARTKGKKEPSKRDLAFALTLILVELASADHNFAVEERTTIVNGIQRVFGTPAREVNDLIEQAEAKLSNFRGTDDVAVLLRDHLSSEERQQILEVINQVIDADGVQDGFEIYHRMRIQQLLGLNEKGEEVP